tara:strand:+ start:88 stop:318 length:231 start_codon:yes stop_codon:yes gene_type:complete
MIALLFTPLGRYIAIGGAVLVALFGVYLKIRADAVEDMKAKAQEDIIERTKDALDAASSVDLNPERLRDTDGHRRD